ncbi:MAG: thioredoxin family protein [Lachnospiraceae bacterium]
MVDIEKISSRSELITKELEEQLHTILKKLTDEVCLVCVIDLADKASIEMAELVRHMVGLSETLSCHFYEKAEAEINFPELDSSMLPVTALYKEDSYTGIAFHGVTGGKEMNSFVLALYNVAGAGQEIDKHIQKKLHKLSHKIEMKIFVSLSCHHCAQQVITCQKMAAESEMIEAKMIDARLYPHLAEEYHIERIPMTIINEKEVLLGVKTIDQMYQIIKAYPK